jgi:hypothetical protein
MFILFLFYSVDSLVYLWTKYYVFFSSVLITVTVAKGEEKEMQVSNGCLVRRERDVGQ